MKREADHRRGLIVRVARGERAALQALYEATAPKLLGIILRILKDRAAAEDTLQEVFVRIWQRAGDDEHLAGTPLVWLVAIARHGRLPSATGQVRTPDPSRGRGWFERVADTSDSEADLARRDALAQCLDQVAMPQRDCLVLAYCEGRSARNSPRVSIGP